MFGQPAGASPFGAPATSTPFGAPAPAFGSPAPATAPAFGAPAPAAGGFGFGAPAPAPATGFGGGGFGTAAPAPAVTSGFGGFGSPAPAPVSAFGAPAASTSTPFGSPTPAPSTGLFGAAPTPAAAPSTGLFGATTTPTPAFGAPAAAPSTGFGGFGSVTTPTTAPAFGTPANTAGAFGSTAPAPTTGGLFGSSPAPAPAFGVAAPAPSAFGAPAAAAPSTGLFGAAPAPATGGLFGAPAAPVGGVAGQGMGTRMAPFQETRTQDGTSNISFQSITAMQQYETKSFEELRMEDYMAGNKGMQGQQAAPATGGFGAPAAPAPALGGGLFGGTTPAPAPSGFGFGAPAPAAATGGLFGKPAPAPVTGGLFGAPAPVPATGGLFGSPAPAPAFGAAPAPAAGGFSFGASTPAPAPATGGLFGAPAPATGGGLFGAPAPATGGLFGSTPAPAPATGGLFGSPAPAPATGGLFGAPTPAPATGGLFGAPSAAPATGGLFGTPAPAPTTGGLFGSTTTPATTTSAFGATPAPSAGGFSFGGLASTPAPVTGGLFGAPAPSSGGGLFGAPAPTTGGLFGSATPAPAGPAFGGGMGVAAATPGQTTILVPPAAEQLLAQKMAAVQNQSKELEVMEAWRGVGPSPKRTGSNGGSNGKIVPTSISQRDAAAVRFRGLAGTRSTGQSSTAMNGAGNGTNGILNSYHGAPRSAAKIRPRGFGPVKSSVGSFAGRSSKGMLSPSAFLGSATKNLIIKPDALAPKPKTRLLLSDDAVASSDKKDSSTPGKERAAATPIVDLIKGPRSLQSGNDTPTPSNGRKDQRDGHIPFENSIIATEKPGFTSPEAGQENSTSPSPPSKTTPLPESSQKKKKAAVETPTDESYDFYRAVIGSPPMVANGESNGFSSTPSKEKDTASLPLPKLTKKGYAMTPTFDALSKMSEADLAAVPSFVVERIGIGSVAWTGAVDVRGIDLDSVLNIEPKAVEVYEDSSTKPPVGTKLNRPAIITLHDVFPKSGPDASTEEKEKFEKKIMRTTKKMGASFILMDADIGVWKFQVEHFSRYALDDDSDDEEDDVNTELINQVENEDAKMDFEEGVRGGRAPSVQQEPWVMTGGRTRFHVPDYDEDMDMEGENTLIVRNVEENRIQAAESAYEQMELLETAQMQTDERFSEEEKSFYPDEGVTCSDVFDNMITPPISIPATNVSICAQIARRCGVKNATSSNTDFGMRMGRSFGVGWGPNGVFVHPADFKDSRSTGEKFITQSKLSLSKNTHASIQEDLLSIHVKHMTNVNQHGECPVFSVEPLSVNKLIEEYFQCVKATVADRPEDRLYTMMSHAFSLISILFSPIPMRRKEQALIMWLRRICQIEVDEDISSSQSARNSYAEIFAALSGDDFSRAASVAMKHGHSMLALMISNASVSAGYLLSDQMKIWNDSGAIRDFPPDLVRIYSLLTRNLQFEEDLHKESSPTTTLDWKRRLAMLYRSIRGEVQLENAALIPMLVDRYEIGVGEGIAPPTQAWFLQPQQSESSGPMCTLFRLLKAFTSLEKEEQKASLSTVISPSGHNPNQFDVSTSFHLAAVLSSLGVCSDLTEVEECTLLDTFAAHLLSDGKWEWAVYVTLCSLNENYPSDKLIASKTRMAKNILDRHYASSNIKDSRIRRSFLEEKLGVPRAWFEEALSNYAIHMGDVQSFLLHSTHLTSNEALQRYEEALLPDALFNGDYQGIAEILNSMDSQGTKRTSLQGAVYEYLKLIEDFIELTTKGDSSGSKSDALIEKAVHIQNCLKSLQGGSSASWKVFSGLPHVPKTVTLTELSSSLTLLITRLNDIRAGHFVAETAPDTLMVVKGTSAPNALLCSNDDLLFNDLDPKSFLRAKYAMGKPMTDIDDDSIYVPNKNYFG